MAPKIIRNLRIGILKFIWGVVRFTKNARQSATASGTLPHTVFWPVPRSHFPKTFPIFRTHHRYVNPLKHRPAGKAE
jgi:hypothetical protein